MNCVLRAFVTDGLTSSFGDGEADERRLAVLGLFHSLGLELLISLVCSVAFICDVAFGAHCRPSPLIPSSHAIFTFHSPPRYSQEMPYAAFTIAGETIYATCEDRSGVARIRDV